MNYLKKMVQALVVVLVSWSAQAEVKEHICVGESASLSVLGVGVDGGFTSINDLDEGFLAKTEDNGFLIEVISLQENSGQFIIEFGIWNLTNGESGVYTLRGNPLTRGRPSPSQSPQMEGVLRQRGAC